jgi:ATP-dependent DNA ligase
LSRFRNKLTHHRVQDALTRIEIPPEASAWSSASFAIPSRSRVSSRQWNAIVLPSSLKAPTGCTKSNRTATAPSLFSTATPFCSIPSPASITRTNFLTSLSLSRISGAAQFLDGEIVALDDRGRADFQELQNRRSTKFPIVYYVFDLLHENGKDLLNLPFSERRQRLGEMAKHFSDPMRMNPAFQIELSPLIAQVKQLGLEGIVAKRATSIYLPGKESFEWQKHRFNQEDTFYIGGYIPGPQGIGELLIGEFRPPGRQLYFIKRLLAGLNKFNRREIYDAVQDLKAKTCPFVNLPEKTSEHQHALTSEVMRECIWTKPEQPCEVEFIERTRSRKLRHAEFRRLLQRG